MADDSSIVNHVATGAVALITSLGAMFGLGRVQAVTIRDLKEDVRRLRLRLTALEEDPQGMPQVRLRVKALEERKISPERVRQIVAARVKEVLEALEETKALASAAVSREEYAQATSDDAEKWEELNRMLGKLEGAIEGIRDQLRGGGNRTR